MKAATKANIEIAGAWCAVVYIVLLMAIWGGIGGDLPPHSPSMPVADVARFYREHTQSIRLGNLGVMFAALALIPFASAVSNSIRRIEGETGTLTIISIFGGVGTMVLTFYPGAWWLTAAYRPERDATVIQLLSDAAWLQFIGGVSMYLALPGAFGIAILCDDREKPAHPRWVGYASLWLMVLVIPDQLLFFFHDGPFAWNGLFGFWLPLVGLAGWFLLAAYFLRREALARQHVPAKSGPVPLPE